MASIADSRCAEANPRFASADQPRRSPVKRCVVDLRFVTSSLGDAGRTLSSLHGQRVMCPRGRGPARAWGGVQVEGKQTRCVVSSDVVREW